MRIYSWLCRGTEVHRRVEWDKEEVVVQAVRTAYWRTLRSRSSCQSARVCKERHSGHIPWSPWFLYEGTNRTQFFYLLTSFPRFESYVYMYIGWKKYRFDRPGEYETKTNCMMKLRLNFRTSLTLTYLFLLTYLVSIYLLTYFVLKFEIAHENDIGDQHSHDDTRKGTCFTKNVSLCTHLCKLKEL